MNVPTECNIMFDVEDSKSVMRLSDGQPGRMWDVEWHQIWYQPPVREKNLVSIEFSISASYSEILNALFS